MKPSLRDLRARPICELSADDCRRILGRPSDISKMIPEYRRAVWIRLTDLEPKKPKHFDAIQAAMRKSAVKRNLAECAILTRRVAMLSPMGRGREIAELIKEAQTLSGWKGGR